MLHLKALSSLARQLKALRCYEIFIQASRVTYTQSSVPLQPHDTLQDRSPHSHSLVHAFLTLFLFSTFSFLFYY